MHITIRKYKVDSPKEVTRLVNDGFFPLIKKVAGFVAYYGIETGEDGWASMSVFETPAGSEESNRVAAEFVKNNRSCRVSLNPRPTLSRVLWPRIQPSR